MKSNALSILLLTGIACIGLSCQKPDGGKNNGNQETPTAKSEAVVSFVSRLSDETLYSSEADFEAIRDYVGDTENRDITYLYLDRADGSGLVYTHKAALKYARWSTFSLYKMNSKDSFSGGYSIYGAPTRKSFFKMMSDDSFVTGVASKCTGKITKLNEDGTAASSKIVDVALNWCTAAFTSESQIDSFLEANGCFDYLKKDIKNFLILGTVRNDVFSVLESKVKAADSMFNVEKIAVGEAWTLCFIASRRYWLYNSVEKRSLTPGGINAYEVNLTWK